MCLCPYLSRRSRNPNQNLSRIPRRSRSRRRIRPRPIRFRRLYRERFGVAPSAIAARSQSQRGMAVERSAHQVLLGAFAEARRTWDDLTLLKRVGSGPDRPGLARTWPVGATAARQRGPFRHQPRAVFRRDRPASQARIDSQPSRGRGPAHAAWARIFLKAAASIWRTRSRVTERRRPISSSVSSRSMPRPKRRRSTSCSRVVRTAMARST